VAPAEARQGGFAPQHGRSGRADDNPRRLERIAGFDGGHRSQDQGWDQGYSGHERSWGRDYRHEAYREGWQDGRGHQRIQHRQEHYRRDEWRHPEWRSHWHHGWGGHRYRAPVRYVYPRGYGRLEWRIGFSLPSVFLLDRYYVDHHYYRIAPPPYGCRWLRVDGDLLLVELATGFVVEALYDFFYW
jgi:Ni/Co efflux regulator RcnB